MAESCRRWDNDMRSVSVRELRQRTSELLRQLRETGEPVEITNRGEPIARLVPVGSTSPDDVSGETLWEDLDRLAIEIAAKWPEGDSAVEAVQDTRRELSE